MWRWKYEKPAGKVKWAYSEEIFCASRVINQLIHVEVDFKASLLLKRILSETSH